MSERDLQVVVMGGLSIVLIAIWAGVVVLGVRIAKSKGRSPHWMWFGLHPIGALIVLIIMGALKPLKICPECARKSPAVARLCPFCRHVFAQMAAGQAPGAVVG